MLVLVFQQPKGKIMRDNESPQREAEGLIVLFLGTTCCTRATYFLDGRKVLWNLYEEMFSKLYSISIADIPNFHITPGKLSDSPVHLGFTGTLVSFSAKPGSTEATATEKPLSFLCTR